MKIFLLFDKANAAADKCAGEVSALITKAGFDVVRENGENEKQDLTDARFLIFIADNASDFSNSVMTSKWRFFINEVRWKRKAGGDIILVCSDDCDLNRIPFSLRDCNILKQSEINQLNKLIMSFAGGNTPKHYSYDTRIRNGSLKAESPADSLSRLSASSSTETTVPETQKNYDDNGCKKDHVFERREFKRSSNFSNKAQVTQAESGHKHESEPQAAQPKTNATAQKSNATVQKPSAPAQQTGATNAAPKQMSNVTQRPAAPSPRPNPQAQKPVSGTRPAQPPTAPTPSPFQRPAPSVNRPPANVQQSRPASPFTGDNDDDYDPFAPPKKEIQPKAVAGCIFGGVFFFIFFIIMIIMIAES